MSDTVSASTNLTKRGSIWQFVLRVPKDLVDEIGRQRIQVSLGTQDEREARRLALPRAEEWEKRFAELRAKRGLVAERPVAGALDTSGWTALDWENMALWCEARLLDADYQARLAISTGVGLLDLLETASRGDGWLKRLNARLNLLLDYTVADYTVADYAEHSLPSVQRAVAPLGVRVEKGSTHFMRFMAACLAAELRALEAMHLRETRRQAFVYTHPDAIQGPWHRAAPAHAPAPAAPIIVPPKAAATASTVAAQPTSGHTLKDCLEQ